MIKKAKKYGKRSWIYGKIRNLEGAIDFVPFRYQGQYEDVESGLYYNRFRYYDSISGNYISQDPIRLSSGEPNFYSYLIDSNSWIDVFGLNPLASGMQIVKDVVNPRKTIILGENMSDRVIPMSERNGYSIFSPRGTNPDHWMRNQQHWIRRQLKDPTVRILEMGPDPDRRIRSKFI